LRRILVIRFGSLGDLGILSWSLAGARRSAGAEDHVTVATKAAYAPLVAAMPGVNAVAPLRGPRLGDVAELAAQLRAERFDAVLDAHDVLRSRLLIALLGRHARRRIAKDTAARLWLLAARRARPGLERDMLARFDAVLGEDSEQPGRALLRGEIAPPLRPRDVRPEAPRRLGIAPGARWDPKRWPEARYAEFLRRFRAVASDPVTIFLGEREEAWFEGSELARTAARLDRVELRRATPLPELPGSLAGCRVLLTNDSGLLHLAEAAGTPVLALFGPTVREFGYYPRLPGSRVLETAIACRPCSRNGKRACHRGDLACLERITPETVLAALLALPAWNAGAAG
jgi:heptosyltransferase-2